MFMKSVLDSILLSNDVCEQFNEKYKSEDFKNWILSILPEVEDCKNLKQDNPWHIYNCLDHILHSVEGMNKQTEGMREETRKMLAYVMFLHDIGKPECYLRRYSKLYGREVDSFFNHNKASVKVAQRVLPSFGFDEQEQKKMELLIEEHDVFMFITLSDDGNKFHKVLNESLVKDFVEKYNSYGDGEEVLSQLIMVGRADNMAQNPKMTKESLHMLDVMNDLLLECYEKEK